MVSIWSEKWWPNFNPKKLCTVHHSWPIIAILSALQWYSIWWLPSVAGFGFLCLANWIVIKELSREGSPSTPWKNLQDLANFQTQCIATVELICDMNISMSPGQFMSSELWSEISKGRNLISLGTIWVTGGESSLRLRLIPLILSATREFYFMELKTRFRLTEDFGWSPHRFLQPESFITTSIFVRPGCSIAIIWQIRGEMKR